MTMPGTQPTTEKTRMPNNLTAITGNKIGVGRPRETITIAQQTRTLLRKKQVASEWLECQVLNAEP